MVVARRVPVAVLAAALGVPGDRVDEVVDSTAVVVAAVAPRSAPVPVDPAATGAALRALRTLLPAADGDRDGDGPIAALSILFQTLDATAALIGNALVAWAGGAAPDPAALVASALRDDPPVLSTRRVGPDGPVAVDLAGLPFGAGPHACPGRDLAVALATGVLAGIAAAGWAPRPGDVTYEPRPNLRLPATVDLVVRAG
jgi:cytochrome P450